KVRDIISRTFKRNDYEMSDGMDLALVMIEQNKLKFAGANNNVWICRDKQQELVSDGQYLKGSITDHCQFIELKADKQPIGHYYKPFPFVQKEIPLLKGDTVILFSDGYADQFGGEKGKKLKVSNFKTLITSAYKLELKDLGTHL